MSNWVITLTATLVGVFLALYLNEWVTGNKLRTQKAIATENVLSEISFNKQKFERAKEKQVKMLGIISFMSNYADWDDGGILVSKDSLQAFQLKYPDTFIVQDSLFVKENIYKYQGELNLDFSLPELEITTIAWKTLKDSGISNTYDFECLLHLETLYNLTDDVGLKNKEFFDYLSGLDEGNEDEIFNTLKFKLDFLIQFEQSLIEMLAISKDKLNNCNS